MSKKHPGLIKTLKEIKEKTDKNLIWLLFDYLKNKKKYKIDIIDYQILEFYSLQDKEKNSIITSGTNKDIIKELNNEEEIFNSRKIFYTTFKRYIGKKYIEIDKDNYNEFKHFASRNKKIKAVKDNIEYNDSPIYIAKDNNLYNLFTNFIEEERTIIESTISSNDELKELNPTSLNRINFITLDNEILLAYLIIGKDENNDTFEKGALVSPINIETGLVDYQASDIDGNIYDRHPEGNKNILWYNLPKWPRIKRFIKTLTEVTELKSRYISWTITIDEKDPILLDISNEPNYLMYQLRNHLSNETLLDKINKRIEKKDEK